MNDLLKLLAILCSTVLYFGYMHYALAKSPEFSPSAEAIISALKEADIKPSILRYGPIADCDFTNTQTILFAGKTTGLQRPVHGFLCCNGDACSLEKMEFDQ